jgi:LysM repeat protein
MYSWNKTVEIRNYFNFNNHEDGQQRRSVIILNKPPMKSKVFLSLSIVLFFLGAAWFSLGVHAATTEPQVVIASPTPGPDGRIIYTVKAGDTCELITMLYGVSKEYLTLTNQLDANCSLREGQELMLGVGGPSSASPTPGPSAIPTAIPPTATPVAGGIGEVCVLVYEDINGDGLRQTTESAIAGAAISLTSLDGAYSQTLTTTINPDTTAYQGMCFANVPMGKYNVSAAAPEDFNPTSNLTSRMEVTPGDTIYIDYGAQKRSTNEGIPSQRSLSPILGILGAILLLAGIGIGIYAWSTLRNT